MPPTHTTPHNRRLIEDWLPVNEISIEAIRERVGAVPNPETHQLHVWWARRPLIISRAAVAASLLPANADRDAFTAALGTYPEIVDDYARIDAAKAQDIALKPPVYINPRNSNGKDNHKRAFTHNLTDDERAWFHANLATPNPIVLDATAGGGSIPFEAARLGLRSHANELNPVANIILHATCKWPQQYGNDLLKEYDRVSERFRRRVETLMEGVYPDVPPLEDEKNFQTARAKRYAQTYLFARAVSCPSCNREIPLSPNWRLSPKGDGVRLLPDEEAGVCNFQIVDKASEQSPGTVKGGIAVCPYPSCGNSTPRGYLAAEAQAGRMGHRLYCVVYRDQVFTLTKAGTESKHPKTTRTFTAPRPEDFDRDAIEARLAKLRPRWDAEGILPDEHKPPGDDDRPITYGMSPWQYIFNPRQRLAHGYCVQAFRELVDEDKVAGELTDVRKAVWCYVGLALDKLISINSLLCRWIPNRSVVAGTFDRHDFGMKWSYAEMDVTIRGLGLEWALRDIGKCIRELTSMSGHPKSKDDASTRTPAFISDDDRPAVSSLRHSRTHPRHSREGGNPSHTDPTLHHTDPTLHHTDPSLRHSRTHPRHSREGGNPPPTAPPSTVTLGPAQELDIPSGSVDAVVFDPPYHSNVNYAELSDFFYVWLKRTVGYVYPDLCQQYLSDKVNEAIASPARFKSRAASRSKSAGKLATEDYHAKMLEIFAECKRVVKPDGVMTVMFTHKANDAWDAMITALIESGFQITRTWPVKTEAEASLHIRGKAAARTTILLVCRPMDPNPAPKPWHEVERQIESAVREDIERLRTYGLKPIDMYIAAFGPALQVISEHWGTEREIANPKRPAPDEFAVTPTDAMEVARREVIRHRVEQLSERFTRVNEPLTRFYVLATDCNTGDTMDYDEALLLARSADLDIDSSPARGISAKRSGKITLKPAVDRMAEDIIGPGRPAGTPIDQVHVAIALTDRQDSAAAENWLTMQAIDPHSDQFKGTLEALHGAMKPGHPDASAARGLYQKLYGVEPPRQMPLLPPTD